MGEHTFEDYTRIIITYNVKRPMFHSLLSAARNTYCIIYTDVNANKRILNCIYF